MSTEPTSPASSARLAPVREGDILASKYRVEKVLGIGGMGVVVKAEHIELSQKVALKFLLKQAAANDDLVGRFLREARASVRLKGSHVAKTLDVGRLEDGCPYIVMEFLDGHDLHAEIRSGGGAGAGARLAIEDAASYVVQAAEGLAEAHALGIVHRDLKPGNLFLTRGVDGKPLVKVLDFGISKTMDSSISGDGLSLTKTEMLLGSPLYMSPEQMRSSKHVDERSDLWALGAIAFELLTGRVPFEADTILELCFKVAQENAPSPKLLREELPDELCLAVLKCLEKDPADRFPNVGELARAFEPFALPRDRGTAERALDVLGTGKRPPMRSVSAIEVPPADPVAAAGAGASASALGAAATPLVTPAPGVPQPASSHGEPVAPAAWGTTQANSATRSRKGLMAVGAAVVAAAFLAGLVVSRKAPPDGAPVAASSTMPSGAVAKNANTNEAPNASAVATAKESPSATTASAIADAGTNAAPSGAAGSTTPATVADRVPKPLRPGATGVTAAASAANAKGAKPQPPAVPPAPAGQPPPAGAAPAADPGGFLKVRE